VRRGSLRSGLRLRTGAIPRRFEFQQKASLEKPISRDFSL
jgi:hypothetical protein